MWAGRPASRCCAWPGTPMPAWPQVSFPLEWGKKAIVSSTLYEEICVFLLISELEHCFWSTGVSFNLVFQLLSAIGCSLSELSNWKESIKYFQNSTEKTVRLEIGTQNTHAFRLIGLKYQSYKTKQNKTEKKKQAVSPFLHHLNFLLLVLTQD